TFSTKLFDPRNLGILLHLEAGVGPIHGLTTLGDCVFGKRSPSWSTPFVRAPLLPRFWGYLPSSLERVVSHTLGILYLPTCPVSEYE
ncbi:hypothetical protein HAX54_004224, partial [Datura stramonium]|nr:hypothetical protein [Datura stramonium]